MVDRAHPLAWHATAARNSNAVRLVPVPPLARFSVRVGAAELESIGNVLGVALPTTACRSNAAHDRVALWLGPDEWMFIADPGTELPPTHRATSIVDMSHAFTGIAVSGYRAAWAINAFCALDLHPTAFPPHACTRTLFGKAQIVLWRIDIEVFRIEVARSFAPYVWDLLEEARLEFLD